LETDVFRRLLAVLIAAAVCAGAGYAQGVPAKKTSFTGDLSYVNASGNTRFATLSVGDRVVHTRGQWTFTEVAGYVRGTTKDSVTARAFRVSVRVDKAIGHNMAAFVGASEERNKFAGFNTRTDEFGGLNWKVIRSPTDTLAFDAGIVYTQQHNVDGKETNYGSARTAEMYKHVFSSHAYFLQLAEYVPSFGDKEGIRVNSETAIVAPISSHLGIKTNYTIRYASKPPAGFGTTDRVLTVGLQITF
jgi:putative salt-induced outer membrane protein YdiY